jgi:hypothetical protein
MANKTTKLWAVNPGNPDEKKLLASFVLKDGDLVNSTVKNDAIKQLVKEGYSVDGEHVTLESDAEQFVELLEGNHASSSFIEVEINED